VRCRSLYLLRADGLKVWFVEWEIQAKGVNRKAASKLQPPAFSLQPFFRAPLNKERRFIPLRLDDAPIKGSLAQFLYINFNWRPAAREREAVSNRALSLTSLTHSIVTANNSASSSLTEQQLNGLVLEPHLLRRDLKKRARRIINRLHHRMENKIMRNTYDLIPFLTDDGETISVVEKVPAPDRTSRTSLEILLEKEDAIRFEEFKAEIRAVLAQERLLLRLFDCFCADICKPKHQAMKLKLPVRHIQDLQRRLRRKLAAHGYVPSSWRSRIQANYFRL